MDENDQKLNRLVPFQGLPQINGSEVYLNNRALQQVKTNYTTAVSVQQPRSIESVTKNVLYESRLAGSSFFYRWEVKNKRTGRKSIVQGASIDLAMCIARNYGNCVVDVEASETDTHYMIKGIFVDLETGFTVPRLYRQRKSQDIGSGYGDDRAEDIVFQIAQSKAQRNAILKAMPTWLVDKCVEAARDAEVSQIKPENLVMARAKVLEFFSGYGISLERIENKIERKIDTWTAEDIVDLRGSATALKEGRITPNELFPTEKGQTEDTESLEEKILNGGKGADIMSEADPDIGKTQDKWQPREPEPEEKPSADADWDPYTAPLQKQYRKAKQDLIMRGLEARNVEFSPNWTGLQLHQALLDDAKWETQEEDEPLEQAEEKDIPEDLDGIIKKLDANNRIFFKRKENAFKVWEAACAKAGIAHPEIGLADLDEADKFDIAFLEIIENG